VRKSLEFRGGMGRWAKYGWDCRMSTKSVGASVYDFVEENGRTYHNYHNGSESSLNLLQ
jgi:hypothetical protein